MDEKPKRTRRYRWDFLFLMLAGAGLVIFLLEGIEVNAPRAGGVSDTLESVAENLETSAPQPTSAAPVASIEPTLSPEFAGNAVANFAYAIDIEGRDLVYPDPNALQSAMAHYEGIIANDPENAAAQNGLCVTFIYSGDYDSAEASCALAAADESVYAAAYLNRGVAALRRGDDQIAAVYYDLTLTLAAGSPVAHAYRGAWRVQQGDATSAEADFNRALELDPNLAIAYWGLGSMNYNIERYDLALENYRRFIELAGDAADSFVAERVAQLENRSGG